MSHVRLMVPVLMVLAALVAAQPASAARNVYVSLGDSYAAGYQATAKNKGKTSENGFAYQLPAVARSRGYRLQLVDFACAGATTTSMFRQRKPCPLRARGPQARSWGGSTQVGAAERYVRANRKRLALVTVSIGGNDVTKCATASNPVLCVIDEAVVLERNVETLARRLRKAAGPRVRIVGLTYPNVMLGLWVGRNPDETLARLSVPAFKAVINPALKTAYATGRARFVDVTAATGGYRPFDETTVLDPYGRVPVAVARVCRLTTYCDLRDIHATTSGYRLIARLVARTLPRRT